MRIFLAGDYRTGSGPANVTKYYKEYLPHTTLYQKRTGKLARIPEIAVNTLRADVVLYSGYSKQVVLGAKLCRLLKKPCVYLMHGCVEYENRINHEEDEAMSQTEREIIRLCTKVYAVSPGFCSWLKEYYPEYSDKFDYITNAIDDDIDEYRENAVREKGAKGLEDGFDAENAENSDSLRDKHMIFTVGGGMPRKRITVLCKAVRLIREKYDESMTLVVAGREGFDSEEINSYDFVVNKGIVDFKECSRLMRKAGIFVQNSCFETFGLAPVEAIFNGCPTLLSKEVGALCLLGEFEPCDIITDCENPGEIADKIIYILENPNAVRLKHSINREQNTWKIRSLQLAEKLSQLQ